MPASKSSQDTRQAILQAAFKVVARDGATKLTLDAAAREAGVSKGGLLYHFPSKDSLIAAMIATYMENFTELMEAAAREDPVQQGRWTRAFVRASFHDDFSLCSGNEVSLFAAIATNPELIAPVRELSEKWQRQIEQDGIDPALATLIRLAADGLGFAELFDCAPPPELLRTQVAELLIKLTQTPLQ